MYCSYTCKGPYSRSFRRPCRFPAKYLFSVRMFETLSLNAYILRNGEAIQLSTRCAQFWRRGYERGEEHPDAVTSLNNPAVLLLKAVIARVNRECFSALFEGACSAPCRVYFVRDPQKRTCFPQPCCRVWVWSEFNGLAIFV